MSEYCYNPDESILSVFSDSLGSINSVIKALDGPHSESEVKTLGDSALAAAIVGSKAIEAISIVSTAYTQGKTDGYYEAIDELQEDYDEDFDDDDYCDCDDYDDEPIVQFFYCEKCDAVTATVVLGAEDEEGYFELLCPDCGNSVEEYPLDDDDGVAEAQVAATDTADDEPAETAGDTEPPKDGEPPDEPESASP
ncbi:MAG: hypothetical protein LBM12_02650 [Candidatus Nomurabacteria bacterium]|jgi:hypothetical protein|nr:hypothetical protein [Candidatus Nomurabacteria bacterium]